MTTMFTRALTAFSLGAMALTGIAATPAAAQSREDRREWREERREDRRDYRRDVREARRDFREDRRDARNDRRNWSRYDWNRPDTRYGNRYRPERYYQGGGRAFPVNRQTRIYRGYDNRYYCRRPDGTTGLIVGAALGGVLGNQLDQGGSGLLGTLLGGGAGALLGRQIDRGGASCR